MVYTCTASWEMHCNRYIPLLCSLKRANVSLFPSVCRQALVVLGIKRVFVVAHPGIRHVIDRLLNASLYEQREQSGSKYFSHVYLPVDAETNATGVTKLAMMEEEVAVR